MSKHSQYKKDLEYLKQHGCKIELVTRVSFSNDLEIASGMNERQTITMAAQRHRHLVKIVEDTFIAKHNL